MPPVGFEPKVSRDERPQTYALGRAATRTDQTDVLEQDIIKLRIILPDAAFYLYEDWTLQHITVYSSIKEEIYCKSFCSTVQFS